MMNIKKNILKIPGVRQIQTELLGYKYRGEEKQKRDNYKPFFMSNGETLPYVSIIILNRNGKKNFETLLPSLDKCRFYDNYEIIIVDNASTDDSLEYIDDWKDKLNITVVKNQKNESFSAANNIGAAASKGDYLLFLNNDTKVTDGFLDELLKVGLTNKQAGAIGARLVYPKIPKGNSNEKKSYRIQHAGICFRDKIRDKMYFVQPYNMCNGSKESKPETGYVERACVTAAVMLVSRKAFDEVGGFDEQYIYGYEDVDICLKLLRAGYHNYYCADSFIYHYEFGTQSADDKNEVTKRRRHNMEVFKGKWQRYLFKTILNEKLNNRSLFTGEKLTFKIVLKSDKEKDDKFRLISEAITKKGYVARLQSFDEDKRYNIGVTADVLICLDPEYDITAVTNVKNDILKVVWDDKDYNDIEGSLSNIVKQLHLLCEDSIDAKEIDICGAMPDNENTKFWGDYHYAVALKKEFEKRGYKANILSHENWYNISTAGYTIVLRGVRPYYPAYKDDRKYIMWNISHPAEVTIEEYKLFDYVFFASEYMKEMYDGKLDVPMDVMPQCTDPDVMKSVDSADKKYELLFVGNSRRVYRRILKDLLPTDHKLTVYGRHWEEFPVQEYVVQAYIDNNVVGQAYHDAKILLNDHWDDMRDYGIISNRIFDALAAKAFVISDNVKGLEDVLGDCVVTYDTRQDLKEKIDYYMEHDKEREEKAKRGQEIVLAKHTFSNRVDKMLSVLESI